MSKISKIAATAAVLPVVALSGATAFAGSPGQLSSGNGNTNYQVKDVTANGSYASTITAACGDTLEYSEMLTNTGYGELTNVKVTATLPQNGGQSNLTATTDQGGTSGTSGSVTVNLPTNATQSLSNGTTVLYDSTGKAIKTLPDTITTSGVNVGTILGSTTEFVNFKAKVGCPTPETPVYTCDALTVNASDNKTVTVSALKTTAQNGATFNNATINWGDNTTPTTASNVAGVSHTYAAAGSYTITATANFTVNGQAQTATSNACKQVVSFSSTTPPTVTPPAAPTQLVNTGAGDTIGIFAAVVAISTIAYRFVLGRRLSRQ